MRPLAGEGVAVGGSDASICAAPATPRGLPSVLLALLPDEPNADWRSDFKRSCSGCMPGTAGSVGILAAGFEPLVSRIAGDPRAGEELEDEVSWRVGACKAGECSVGPGLAE